MGFFKELDTKSKDDQADALSTRLRRVAGKANWFVSKDKTKWSPQFRVLINRHGFEVVDQVLKWYESNYTGKGVPSLNNGDQFKRRFDWVRKLMDLHTQSTWTKTDKGTSLTKSLKNLTWPKGSSEQLHQVVEITLDRYTKFRKLIQDVAAKEQGKPLGWMAKTVLAKSGSAEEFTKTWMEMVHRQISDWDDWSGDLLRFAFRPDHKAYQAMGRGWATDFAGSPKRWESLMEVCGVETK